MTKLRYAYYPGCASNEITKEADITTKLVAEKLGIELVPMPGANCCGAGLATDYDKTLSNALNARIFSQAEKMGLDILTICSTCLMVMRSANHEMKTSKDAFDAANGLLKEAGLHYNGGVEVKHLLWAIVKDVGLGKLRKAVTTPLKGLKAAPFYGCHTLRPSYALGFDDPENPKSLEQVIEAVGADAIDYEGKTKCCSFQTDLIAPDTALDMTAKRLIDAKEAGATCIVTPCPFCHINLDNYQKQAEKRSGRKINLPVFHLPQIIGAAMGFSHKEMGLSRHLVSFKGVFE